MPEFSLLIRRDEIDFDYINQLSEEEKAFLNQFSEEWISAKFHKDDKRNLMKGKKKRDAYGHNNARNRCQFSRARARNLLTDDYIHMDNYEVSKDDYENKLIEAMDAKREYESDDEY